MNRARARARKLELSIDSVHPFLLAAIQVQYSATAIFVRPRCASRKAAMTTIPISKLASAVQPSATMAAAAKARHMKAEGVKIFDFSLGEPDYNTPDHIVEAAFKAMKAGQTHYTPA